MPRVLPRGYSHSFPGISKNFQSLFLPHKSDNHLFRKTSWILDFSTGKYSFSKVCELKLCPTYWIPLGNSLDKELTLRFEPLQGFQRWTARVIILSLSHIQIISMSWSWATSHLADVPQKPRESWKGLFQASAFQKAPKSCIWELDGCVYYIWGTLCSPKDVLKQLSSCRGEESSEHFYELMGTEAFQGPTGWLKVDRSHWEV